MIDDFQIRNLLSCVIYVVVAHELVKALIVFFYIIFPTYFFLFFLMSAKSVYMWFSNVPSIQAPHLQGDVIKWKHFPRY